MATATLQATPNPAPPGVASVVTVNFVLDPGKPDATYTAVLYQDGTERGRASVVLDGSPAETLPAVALNTSTSKGWEIRFDGGNVTTVGTNQFRVTR